MLKEKIISIKEELINYANLVESMIEKSIKGLSKKEKEILSEVIEKDELKANNFEIEIDEICTNIIAQYEPKARDLRTVLMILKMNNDLERIGDEAVNISQSGMFLIERPQIKLSVDIQKMAEETIKMLKDSINSFINEDSQLAKEVCLRDSKVDKMRNQIWEELINIMKEDTSNIERSIHIMRISRNLERIADLSTNICEDVIFMVEGRVIKHHQEEKIDKNGEI